LDYFNKEIHESISFFYCISYLCKHRKNKDSKRKKKSQPFFIPFTFDNSTIKRLQNHFSSLNVNQCNGQYPMPNTIVTFPRVIEPKFLPCWINLQNFLSFIGNGYKTNNVIENLNVFSNKCVYKVAIFYPPYRLVYVLYSLMLTKYVILSFNGRWWNVNPI
jgi:hypothetical protein